MNAMLQAAYATETTRREAVRRRDPAADGAFLYSVASTGVYCRPSCAARPARPENVGFHADRAEAERAGFRPCRRCRPDLPPRAEREAALIADACRGIEAAETPPSLAALAQAASLSPHHFHRLFRRIAGVTPKAYADAWRQSRVQRELGAGAPVTAALYDAGFSSAGRFYATADAMLGMTPSAFRAGGRGEAIHYATGESALGGVLVAGSARGICAILLGDDAAALLADLGRRFPKAALRPAEAAFAETVRQVVALVDTPGDGGALPLDIRGTAFQRRVWEALRAIPPGSTLSYGALATRIGAPGAVRAVASACAANPLAVVVPCHRVVASDGGLAGYRWGISRKRRLLEREGHRSATHGCATMQADLLADLRAAEALADGAWLLPGFAQADAAGLLAAIAAIAAAAPFRHMQVPGGQMSVAMTGCGRVSWVGDRHGYRYAATDPLTGQAWPALPPVLLAVAAQAAEAAGFARFVPDSCLVNRYAPRAKMGLHRDGDERDFSQPIVSVSLGLAAVFLWGGLRRADRPRRVTLQHADVVVWGGPARLTFHGVAALAAGEHPLTGACRYNLTFRHAL